MRCASINALPAFTDQVGSYHVSMAQQDVRFYLNGMLLETEGESLQ